MTGGGCIVPASCSLRRELLAVTFETIPQQSRRRRHVSLRKLCVASVTDCRSFFEQLTKNKR